MSLRFALFVCCLLCLPLHLFAQKDVFTVSYDPDYAPFSYYSNDKPEGLLIDYWRLWAKKNNYTLKFVNGHYWDDAIEMVKNDKVDFFLGTAPYEPWMKSSNSFYTTKTSLFTYQSNQTPINYDFEYTIGIIGEDYTQIIKQNFPNSKLLVYKDYESITKDLIAKKIDMLYDDKLAIEFYTLQQRLFHQVKSVDLLKETSTIHAIANNDKLIEIFNRGFRRINEQELQTINNKWLIKEESYKSIDTVKQSFTQEEKNFIQNTIIKVSVSKNWKPFSFESINHEATGISSDIWKLLENKIGLRSEYTFFEQFTNQLNAIKTKEQDIILSTGKTKEREAYALFTKEYINFPISIVTLKDENFIENMEQIKDKSIAVGRNFTAHKLLTQNYENLNLVLVDSIQAGLEAVENNEVYAYIDIKPNLTYNIAKEGFENLKITGNTGLTFELRMMIRDDYHLLHSILNKTIAQLNEKDIQPIVSSWNNIQFEDRFDYELFWGIIFIIFILFGALIYRNRLVQHRNKELEKVVQNRTKELQQLNDNLEIRVEEKIKELKKTNYLLDEAQKIARLGSFQYDLQRKELFWSDQYYRILGLEPRSIDANLETFLAFVHPEDKAFLTQHVQQMEFNEKKLTIEFRLLLQNDAIRYVQVTSKVTKFDENGNALFMVGTLLDVTKIKTLELEKREKDSLLAQQAKMAAMGEMLENIAHQWRQPLSVISTASTGLELQLELNDHVPKDILTSNVKSINEQTQYLSKTIDDFRNFFNPNRVNLEFSIEHCINKSLDLIASKIKKFHITIVKDIADHQLFALENELIQVLLNLLNNAIDALDEKEVEEKFIFITAHKKNGTVIIAIKDNAGGIKEEIITRVFEPYFTTKHQKQGTGIGLYMSTQIVAKHLKGSLEVSNQTFTHENHSYHGSEFVISIPYE